MDPLINLSSEVFLQYGFAAVSVVLFGILIWLIKSLLTLQKETNKVIGENTAANNRITDLQQRQATVTESMHDRVLVLSQQLESRPCLEKYRKGI